MTMTKRHNMMKCVCVSELIHHVLSIKNIPLDNLILDIAYSRRNDIYAEHGNIVTDDELRIIRVVF